MPGLWSALRANDDQLFIGDLRRVLVGGFPILYSLDQEHWANAHRLPDGQDKFEKERGPSGR